MPRTTRHPLSERFWEKVDKRGPDECWPWLAYTAQGYGRINAGGDNGKSLLASRVSWVLHNGPIPDGLFVCHKCDNPSCVNPSHLFLGTQRDNMRDCSSKGRARGGVRGEQNGNAKLNADQVRAIRMSNLPRREVIARYGISKTQYGNIKRGDQWKSVM